MSTRDVVLIALFTALVVALGLIPGLPIAVIPVPVVLQNLGLMLAAAILGGVRGAAVAALLVLLVALGLPVLSGGRGGLGVLGGPTAGFILGWIPGAYVTGLVAFRLAGQGTGPVRTVLATVAGVALGMILVDYALGILGLVLLAGAPLDKAATGMLVFVPIDLAKGVVAGLVAHAVRRAYPL